MTTREPALSEVHADLVGRLQQDERLRKVEQDLAALRLLPAEIQRMEARLVTAIEANRPRSPWTAVSAMAAVLTVVLIVSAALYGPA
jgi:hypothetical protein